jgi:hypothetical protein
MTDHTELSFICSHELEAKQYQRLYVAYPATPAYLPRWKT